MEIQTAKDGAVGNIVTAYDDKAAATSKFYTVMAAAALSDLPMHAVLLIQSDGMLLESGRFERPEAD